jgi:hypothetical protein
MGRSLFVFIGKDAAHRRRPYTSRTSGRSTPDAGRNRVLMLDITEPTLCLSTAEPAAAEVHRTATVELGRKIGVNICSIQAREDSPSIRPSRSVGATRPASVRPPTKVMVFQCPCGIAARQRSPLSAQPRRRVIFVERPLSSMKIRRSGQDVLAVDPILARGLPHQRALARWHERSFFIRQAVPVDKVPHCSPHNRDRTFLP